VKKNVFFAENNLPSCARQRKQVSDCNSYWIDERLFAFIFGIVKKKTCRIS